MIKKHKRSLSADLLCRPGMRATSSFAMAPVIDRDRLYMDQPAQSIAVTGKSWRLRLLERVKVS